MCIVFSLVINYKKRVLFRTCFLFLVLLPAVSCRESNSNLQKAAPAMEIQGYEIELSYLPLATFAEGDIFSLDNIFFCHGEMNYNRKPAGDTVFLTTSRYVIDRVEGKKFYEKSSPAEQLLTMHHSLLMWEPYKSNYRLSGSASVVATGKLRIKRTDGGLIHIKITRDYPLQITVVR